MTSYTERTTTPENLDCDCEAAPHLGTNWLHPLVAEMFADHVCTKRKEAP